jgi:hypothetical protein
MTAWYFHGTLAYVIYIYGIYFYGFYFYGHTSIKLKKAKLLIGLTCVLKEIYKYAQKQNLEVKQIFV